MNSLATAPLQPVGDKRVDVPKVFDPEAQGAYDEDLTATTATSSAPQAEAIDPAQQPEDGRQEGRLEAIS